MGWWEQIATLEAEHVSLIEHLSGLSSGKYRLKVGDEPIRSRLVNAFVADLMPSVVSAVSGVTKGATASVKDFADNRQAIEQCLMNGIV